MTNWTNDERVRRSNGQVSRPRVIVLEALEAQGREGATLDDLVNLIGMDMRGDNPKTGIGKTIHSLAGDGHVQFTRGRWYLTECAPPKIVSNGHASEPILTRQSNGSQRVAAFSSKRSEKQVSIYTSPRVFGDVIGVSLLIAQRWYRLPLFGNVRICIGFEAPNWSADQEMFADVETIKILHAGGKVTEEHPAPKDLVTVAPEV